MNIWSEKTKRLVKSENTFLVYNNQLKFIDDYTLKYHQRTPTKQIPSEKLLKSGSTSSPFSIQFPSQETIAERVNLKPRERKKNRNRIKNFNFKRTINQTSSNITSTNKSWKQSR